MRARASFGLLLLALAGATPPALAVGGLYCCQDEYGKQVCGDILPQACYGRAYRELGESGRTVRRVEAPLTAEQRAQQSAEEVRRMAQEAALKERQRKDQALLNTYGNEKDLDVMRLRAEEDVRQSVRNAESKIDVARQKRKEFEDEAEFYKKKRLPLDVEKGLRDADYEIKAQELFIEAKKRELETIRAKFDEDRRRLLELSRRGLTPR